MNINALIELAKSFGRFMYFGILGLVTTWIASLIASGSLNDVQVTIGGSKVSVGIVLVMILTGLYKLIDRYIHVNEDISSNGLAPTFLQK